MILRFREDNRNERHCRVSVFTGRGPTLALSGVLTLDTEQWDAMRPMLAVCVTVAGVTFEESAESLNLPDEHRLAGHPDSLWTLRGRL